MKYFYTKLFLILFLLFGLGQQASAEGWYVGGGLSKIGFSKDLNGVDDANGLAFLGGYRFANNISTELMVTSSLHDEEFLNGDAAYGSILGGGKFSFGSGQFQPYLAIGISLQVIDFDFFEEITGAGTYLGIGADIYAARNHVVNFSVRNNTWDGEDTFFDYDNKTRYVTFAYNYYFTP